MAFRNVAINRSSRTPTEEPENENQPHTSPDHPPHIDTYFSDEQISIPTDNSVSFKKLWAFTGPGFLMSIAFLDPGNVESDLEAGSITEYRLLWVLLWSTVLGLLIQRLSARLGVVTGFHLAEMCNKEYKKLPRILLWLMIEVAIIGSDMQEVIGTAVAIYLLSNTIIPIWGGVLITIIDTFSFVFLEKYGLRKLELFFAFLISVMAGTFGFEYFKSKPDTVGIIKGLLNNWCDGCDNRALLQAVGIIGAIIMPHNLFLHSALVKTRSIDRNDSKKVREANMYYFIEAAIALFVSFLINLFVISVFAKGLYLKTNLEVHESCLKYPEINASVFPLNNETVEADLYKGGIFLGCTYGLAAMYIWAVGILAAGQSSTMTGTYAGQFSMEGFLNLQWPKWKRVLLTRSIAIIPTFLIAFYKNLEDLTEMNDLLNALMSIQLPFALIPCIAFTSNKRLMGEFVNSAASICFSIIVSFFLVVINIYFVLKQVEALEVYFIVLISISAVFYLAFCLYLVIHMLASMGLASFENNYWIRKYILVQNEYNLISTSTQRFPSYGSIDSHNSVNL